VAQDRSADPEGVGEKKGVALMDKRRRCPFETAALGQSGLYAIRIYKDLWKVGCSTRFYGRLGAYPVDEMDHTSCFLQPLEGTRTQMYWAERDLISELLENQLIIRYIKSEWLVGNLLPLITQRGFKPVKYFVHKMKREKRGPLWDAAQEEIHALSCS